MKNSVGKFWTGKTFLGKEKYPRIIISNIHPFGSKWNKKSRENDVKISTLKFLTLLEGFLNTAIYLLYWTNSRNSTSFARSSPSESESSSIIWAEVEHFWSIFGFRSFRFWKTGLSDSSSFAFPSSFVISSVKLKQSSLSLQITS